MADKTLDGISVLEGLEAVRRRPAMYIGAEDEHPSLRARLLELAVTDIAWEWRPQEVRILLWREDAVTIAYDGRPPRAKASPSSSISSKPWRLCTSAISIRLLPSSFQKTKRRRGAGTAF
jgi:DNA gyrase/topoisomerase IV subunit B